MATTDGDCTSILDHPIIGEVRCQLVAGHVVDNDNLHFYGIEKAPLGGLGTTHWRLEWDDAGTMHTPEGTRP